MSDDPEQTYIQKEESRDGEDVTGSYQYVDANNIPQRVDYVADDLGFRSFSLTA